MKDIEQTLGNAQLEVLQYVAENHPITVGRVAEHFAEHSGKARTTILTVMEKLREKGFLTRKKKSGVYEYSPTMSASDIVSSVVARFVEETLGGSISPFISYLANSSGLTDAELKQLRRIAKNLNEKNGKDQ
ncbi:MAG: BlaI/MecI/CopY family transcriptional regulator [Planctomycetales bacterium]|nr:BlaI/MecI/CopY family transcriptional regulator [Planctomycetales bacterium]